MPTALQPFIARSFFKLHHVSHMILEKSARLLYRTVSPNFYAAKKFLYVLVGYCILKLYKNTFID